MSETTERMPFASLRWKLFYLLTRSRRVCPANAHGALIWRNRPLRDIGVDSLCRRDAAENEGVCWCGNIRPSPSRAPSTEP